MEPARDPIYVSLDQLAQLVHVATTEEAIEAAKRMKDNSAAKESARRVANDIDSFVERKVVSEL